MIVASVADQSWAADLGSVPGVEIVVAPLDGSPLPRHDIEVVVPPYAFSWDRSALQQLPRLRLVQLLTAGYDGLLELLPPGVALANAADVHSTSTAELAVTLALSAQRGVPTFVRDQDEERWGSPPPGMHRNVADSRVLVLGYGSIGRAVATRLRALEARVSAVASIARDGDDVVDQVHGIDAVLDLVPGHDIVIVAVPLSPATEGLVDGAFLAAMPDDALLVNVARGRVVDTRAVLAHVGRLRFALDVTDPEPLPLGHRLWRSPGVLISPHTGGASRAFRPRAVRLLRDQFARLAAGEPPRHVVGIGSVSS